MYNDYTKVLNGLLGLTNKQVLVLSKLFELSHTTSKLLSRDNRREIIEVCNIDECNLSTYLTLFKQKKILVKVGDIWKVDSNILPSIIENKVHMSFNIIVDESNIPKNN